MPIVFFSEMMYNTKTEKIILWDKLNFAAGEKTMSTKIKDFTKGNITKQLITFAWPLFLSNLL